MFKFVGILAALAMPWRKQSTVSIGAAPHDENTAAAPHEGNTAEAQSKSYADLEFRVIKLRQRTRR
ncbi:MAG: hypothetical protein ABI980_07650 [Nitrospirota bacterium]